VLQHQYLHVIKLAIIQPRHAGQEKWTLLKCTMETMNSFEKKRLPRNSHITPSTWSPARPRRKTSIGALDWRRDTGATVVPAMSMRFYDVTTFAQKTKHHRWCWPISAQRPIFWTSFGQWDKSYHLSLSQCQCVEKTYHVSFQTPHRNRNEGTSCILHL
jgi:hypothetical protein